MFQMNITRCRGDDYDLVLVVKNSKAKPVNIFGWTDITMTVDPSSAPADNTTKVSTMTGVLTTNGLDGSLSIAIDPAIPVGNYFYDLQITQADGKKRTIARGKYIVEQDITK